MIANCGAIGAAGVMNCGTKAMKKPMLFGLRAVTNAA
jgi:hypothetical protein